jgi:hypothetical protein
MKLGIAHSKVLPTPASAHWLVSLAFTYPNQLLYYSIHQLFLHVHYSVRPVHDLTLRLKINIPFSFIFSAPGIVASQRVGSGAISFCVV